MMHRFYWLVIAALIGVAMHMVTVLYLPGPVFARNLSSLTYGQNAKGFILLPPDKQGSLVPGATENDIVGLCLVDLSKGKVVISPHVPKSLWSFAVYSMAGQQAYGLNDVEAGSDHFSVELAPAKSLTQQLFGKADVEDAGSIQNVGWHAQVVGSKAVAVLWMPVIAPQQRKDLEAVLKATSCNG